MWSVGPGEVELKHNGRPIGVPIVAKEVGHLPIGQPIDIPASVDSTRGELPHAPALHNGHPIEIKKATPPARANTSTMKL